MEEPIYKTLEDLVDAVKKGECPPGVLTLDNDSTTMYEDVTEIDSDGEEVIECGRVIFRGGTPLDLLEEALDLLGVPNEPA